jgi:hypothetical protein
MSKIIFVLLVTITVVVLPSFRDVSLFSGSYEIAEFSSEDAFLAVSMTKLIKNEQNLPNLAVLEKGLSGLSCLKEGNQLNQDHILTIVDFSLPSTEKRLWVLDLKEGKTMLHSLVAHGRNTGELFAEEFSNKPESYTSSLGFYVTGDKYQGSHGLSMYLDGKERDINHLARERAIVMHAADYATEKFIRENGRLGRSFGCPSVPPEINEEIIETIAGGTCFFIYAENSDYLNQSVYIN